MDPYNNIPVELKKLTQWVNFKIIDRDGKKSKIPFDAKTGKGAKANDKTTWSSYEQVITALKSKRYDGIGLEFDPISNISGIDLDHVIDENGRISAEALEIVNLVNSYTEYSPSGRGLHILFKGHTNGKNIKRQLKTKGQEIEIYSRDRYFTITGKIYEDKNTLREASDDVLKIINKYDPPKEQQKPSNTVGTIKTDYEIINAMFNSKNGAEIKALWSGDLSAYGDDASRGDMALVNHLCYWTNGDFNKIDALFRQSALYREKWDEMRGSDTYGNITINTALAQYKPYTKAEQPKKQNRPIKIKSVAEYFKTQYRQDIDNFKTQKQRKTGFSNLDNATGGLFPGLYVIGALSSLGKTTFTHQLGDQLAEQGDKVLYFSLEQSTFELATKSLSRLSYKLDPSNSGTALEIRAGKTNDTIKQAGNNYMAYAENMHLIECNFDTDVMQIVSTVKEYVKDTNILPVVIVDYLQIIPSLDYRMSDKEKADNNIRALKKLQSELGIVVIVISSINRTNYLTPISQESFKESGGIEYTADVILGLQYEVLSTSSAFTQENNIKEKREAIQRAKDEQPRNIELVCLKNRNGRDFKISFKYNSKYDTFTPKETATQEQQKLL